MWSFFRRQWSSVCVSQTRSISITWQLVRHANSGEGAWQSLLIDAPSCPKVAASGDSSLVAVCGLLLAATFLVAEHRLYGAQAQ